MNHGTLLDQYLSLLKDEHVLVKHESSTDLAPAHLICVDPEDWGQIARHALAQNWRWAGMWGDHCKDQIKLYASIEQQGFYIVLHTELPVNVPILSSHTVYYPGANRLERHTQDMLGIAFSDHPDERRWTRHLAWEADQYPLRENFSVAGKPADETPPDGEYRFIKAQGPGVYEIPVGPVHAGIIEPGHFRFQAVGEDILKLDQHLGYVHKGIEKIAVGREANSLARLAGRVSGDTTVAHTWAACQAMERANNTTVPARANIIRAIMSERERIANHLGDIGAICNDVSFAFAIYQCSRLRENWQRRSKQIFGHRLMMDCIIPGGVTHDISNEAENEMQQESEILRTEVDALFDIFEDHPSLDDRLLTTGRLTLETASKFGTLGYVGKASGQDCDVRKNHRYAPYDNIEVPVPLFEDGDVAARMQVRMDEIYVSMDLIGMLLQHLEPGEISSTWETPEENSQGIGIVEGWRGEIISFVRFGTNGNVARYFPRDPSWFTWPALELIVMGNIVPDFPVCNKSVNGSYSGNDL